MLVNPVWLGKFHRRVGCQAANRSGHRQPRRDAQQLEIAFAVAPSIPGEDDLFARGVDTSAGANAVADRGFCAELNEHLIGFERRFADGRLRLAGGRQESGKRAGSKNGPGEYCFQRHVVLQVRCYRVGAGV
jgi:hypothetical protein